MSHSQSGILKDHSRFGIFIEAMVQGPLADIKTGCQRFVDALTQLQEQYPSDRLGAVIAFGSDIWKQLSAPESAPELKPFRQLGKVLHPQHNVTFLFIFNLSVTILTFHWHRLH